MLRKLLTAGIALGVFAVMPLTAFAQETQIQIDQNPTITVIPMPERDYAIATYNAIPVSDRAGFITWLSGFPPDQQVYVLRGFHNYYVATDVSPFTMDTTPEMAMPIFVKTFPESDQNSFTTYWNSWTPDQQVAYVRYAREAYPVVTRTVVVTTPSNAQSSDTMNSAGVAAQPFGATIATAFVATLPAAAHTSYMNLATNAPISELGGMNQFLSTLTPDQAGMVVQALASVNAMGMSGAHPQKGMSEYNAKQLLLGQVADADKSNFDSMINGMTDQQVSSLYQLTRDAFNGGLNDIGASATTATMP